MLNFDFLLEKELEKCKQKKVEVDKPKKVFPELYEKNKYEPNPRLKEDTQLWQAVLKNAYSTDRKLYGILHGIRICGGMLVLNEGQLQLKPRYGYTNTVNMDRERWKEVREKWLLPHKKLIMEIFDRVAKEFNPEQEL